MQRFIFSLRVIRACNFNATFNCRLRLLMLFILKTARGKNQTFKHGNYVNRKRMRVVSFLKLYKK